MIDDCEDLGTLPPHDLEAESAVLGACLLDAETYGLLASKLQPQDYYRESHRIIWAAMGVLAARRERIDILTLRAELEHQGKLDGIGGTAYLAGLSEGVYTSLHAEHYANIVGRCATNRRLITAGGKIAALGHDNEPDTESVLAQAEQAILEVRRRQPTSRLLTPYQRADNAMQRLADTLAGVKRGIPYGFRDLDSYTGGMQPGQLVLIAGRPSMGKSLFLSNVAEHLARLGKRVLFCSAEMPDDQLMDRTLAGVSGVPLERLASGHIGQEDEGRLSGAIGVVADWPLYLLDSADMTTADVRAAATEMRLRHGGLDLIAVDYVQLLKDRGPKGANDNSRVAYISSQLKAIARACEVPLLAACQLNRACEERDDKRPVLSDLRDSGALDQDADVALMLYRDSEYWTEEQWDERERKRTNKTMTRPIPYPRNITEVILRKQRQGKRHVAVRLVFVPQQARFQDYTGEDEPW